MNNLIEKNNLLKPPKVGDIIKGKISHRKKGAVFLDLGIWGTGIIYGKELTEGNEILKDTKTGDEILAKIVDLKNEQGYVELSISQAGKELIWEELKQKKEKGEIIKIKINGANKGGLLTDISGIQAFLPVSQLTTENYPKLEKASPEKILKELQKFIGKELEVQIFSLDAKTNKLILSEKLKESVKIKELLKNYKVGDVIEGEITGILEFGAFIKFDSIEGLIHISELDWKIIESPSEIVKLGQKVKAKIINIANDKVFLSLKALKKDPWEGIEKIYKKGDKISGKVKKINYFGAFVQINKEIQGLCHVSEFGSVKKMEEKLNLEKEYNFEILEVKPKEHKITLKLIE